MNETTENIVTIGIPGAFSAIAVEFVSQSLDHMIPWLIVSFAVIVCDLIVGIRKSLTLGEEVRFSRAVRRTMGKCVTYFAFVCTVCMVDAASGGTFGIDLWSCLLVCFIEGCSIVSNILKSKGYRFNAVKAVGMFCSKAFKLDGKEVEGIITKDGQDRKEEA